ncbi:hypothetical protein NQ318_018395 [Aromia moschata]|uniref:Rab-GAP TBC domain-containing protein n=1 Tax=Aromia moschata TaxID=1265417 RepID=A0AAV8XC14_9CUCU|nr:hypothetical protein NQ318_018395 [Aromia moschata]
MVLKFVPWVKKRSGYKYIFSTRNHDNARSQSLPECLDENNELNGKLDRTDNCDIRSTLLTHCKSSNSPSQSPPLCDLWFKTWPERCDKLKSDDSRDDASDSPIKNTPNTHNTHVNSLDCDTLKKSNIKNKFTLNEALQNISLAYSPVTKQLHLIEKPVENTPSEVLLDDSLGEPLKESISQSEVNTCLKKSGHRRTEAGSFSSTVSTLSGLSDPSPLAPRKKSLTNFFSKNVFSWKSGSHDLNSTGGRVWKLFSKHSDNDVSTSPIHVIASSSALIQHERPSNLPAKTLEEEQRHRDEYKAILAAAKKKEAQNSVARQKQQKLQLQLEEQQAAATKHFMHQVLPNWEGMRRNKKTQDLWWQGLPSSVRGKVWRLAIGNELNVTPQLYEICLCRAQNRLNSPEPPKSDADIDPESSMDVIQLDISRTFPHLCIFQEGGPYSETLHSLLAAYVCYRPDVGYVQGMSYIAAILILNMEQFDAFICFANLLNQPLHLSAFTLNQTQMQAYYSAYNEVFSYNLPKLYLHFEKSGLTPDLYLLDWIYTIFAKAMPLDVACRVWDIFLRDGYEFIFRTALGILHLNQDILMNMDFLHGAQFLTHLPDDMSSDQLFKSIQLVTTAIGKQSFSQIVEKCTFTVTEH